MKSMKRMLVALALFTITVSTSTLPIACGSAQQIYDLKNLEIADCSLIVKDPTKLTDSDAVSLSDNLIINIKTEITKVAPKAKAETDYTTDIHEKIKIDANISDGVTIEITAVKDSKLLSNSTELKVHVSQEII